MGTLGNTFFFAVAEFFGSNTPSLPAIRSVAHLFPVFHVFHLFHVGVHVRFMMGFMLAILTGVHMPDRPLRCSEDQVQISEII